MATKSIRAGTDQPTRQPYSPEEPPRLPLDFGDYLSLLWRLDTAAPQRERYYRQCAQALGTALGLKPLPIFRLVENTPAGEIYSQLPNLPYRSPNAMSMPKIAKPR